MVTGFVVWSIGAAILFYVGIICRKSREVAGFFTFAKPPLVNDIARYNNAVSILWFVAAGVLEIIGIPLLFLEQNSPLFILLIFAVIIGIIAMMFAYLKIEAKRRR